MKDRQKIAQAKRMEDLIVYLNTTTRDLAKITQSTKLVHTTWTNHHFGNAIVYVCITN